MPSLPLSRTKSAGRRAANSPVLTIGARVGLVSRSIVWLLMGVLAIEVAAGTTHRQADQVGALASIASHTGGWLLLILLAAGLACYALWRLIQAAVGPGAGAPDAKERLASVIRAVMYAILCATTVSVVAGAGKSQDQQQRGMTADLMQHTGGRWLVGVAGAVVIGVGLYFAQQGVRRDIYGHLDKRDVPEPVRPVVVVLGIFGNAARGVVIALVGVLMIWAAVTADPQRSSGLDGALRTVARQPFGPPVIALAGAGLIAFALFGIAEGVWSKV